MFAMELPDMDSMAASIGVSIPVLRFLLCFAATIPVDFFHRFVPGGPVGRHLYAAATGAFLSYLSFGFSSNLHFVVPMLLGYASMVLWRKHCGSLTFFLCIRLSHWMIWQPSKQGLQPSPYLATFRALLQAAICKGLYLYLVPHFPLSRFTEPVYLEYGFFKRLGYQ